MSPSNSVDVEALRAKYDAERAKRLRPDGTAQFHALEGDSPLLADPFSGEPPARDPISREVDVVVLGGGFAGVLGAGRIKQLGVEDVLLFDSAGDFGGTWYWNRFPGIHCDVESYIYLPLLEELGYVPSQKYASGEEILGYVQQLARHFDLYPNAQFHTRVTEARWDAATARWQLATNRGDRVQARVLILGPGAALNRPKLPKIPGLESFEGHWFHTSRWDYDYTGGTPAGGMTNLRDKRVAVIGTGATAIQCAPHLAADARELLVFQRTPSAVDARNNGPTDEAWFSSLEPGWQAKRKANFDLLISGFPQPDDLVGDQWTEIWGMPEFELPTDGTPPDMTTIMAAVERHDFEQMERIRQRVADTVSDQSTADALKPYYGVRCKRPTFNDEYLQAFNRPNVTLVDTDGHGVEAISAHAIHANGREYPVDCIVYATGFESLTSPDRAGDVKVVGLDGSELADTWRRVETVHGVACHNFPNMFVLGGIRHAAITINVTYMITEQAKHVAEIVNRLLAAPAPALQVTAKAVQKWGETIEAKAVPGAAEAGRTCTPGFYNNEGRDEGIPIFATHYGGGPLEYIDELTAWRAHGFDSDVEFLSAPAAQEA